MSQDPFIKRHIGTDERGVSEMLRTIGVRSTEELIEQVIPDAIRLKKPLNLPPQGMSEYQFAAHIRAIAGKNKLYRSLIGMGYYGTATPAVIQRNVFENPAWYTSYTPYQAEISQGRLEALLNFQTAVISLTGMEVGNCSLLDEATAAAEAMLMMYALRSREAVQQGRNILFVDENIFPQTFDLLLTRSEPFGIEIVCDSYDGYEFSGPRVRGDRPVPGSKRSDLRLRRFRRSSTQPGRPGRRRGGHPGPGPAESPRRMGRGHRRGIDPTVRPSDGIRRPARRFPDYEGRL